MKRVLSLLIISIMSSAQGNSSPVREIPVMDTEIPDILSPLPALSPEIPFFRGRTDPGPSYDLRMDEETPSAHPPTNCRSCDALLASIRHLREEISEKEAEVTSLRHQLLYSHHQVNQTLEDLGTFLDSFSVLERNIRSLRRRHHQIQQQLEASTGASSALGGARLVASRLVQEGVITPADIVRCGFSYLLDS